MPFRNQQTLRDNWFRHDSRGAPRKGAAPVICRQRASTVECVNAQARHRGLIRLLVRGLQKVKAVALWFAIAHNIACGLRLRAGAAVAG